MTSRKNAEIGGNIQWKWVCKEIEEVVLETCKTLEGRMATFRVQGLGFVLFFSSFSSSFTVKIHASGLQARERRRYV